MAETLLVTPSYRDSARLQEFGNSLAKALSQCDHRIRWVIADDGSGKQEAESLRQLVARYQEIHPATELFVTNKHLGKGGTIKMVWNQASEADWLCFIDADGSIDAPTFLQLLEIAKEKGKGSAVLASRKQSPQTTVRQTLMRKWSHLLFAFLNHLLLKLPVYDAQCGCKIVHREDYQSVSPQLVEDGFLFDSELLLLLQQKNILLYEQSISWSHVPGGAVSIISDSLPMLQGLVRVFVRHRVKK
ncbi:MAG: glycosyltransferase [Verrucomicrobiota bacterium]